MVAGVSISFVTLCSNTHTCVADNVTLTTFMVAGVSISCNTVL